MAYVNNDPAPRQPKILLVDDREDNLLSIEAILSSDGYQFFRAYSGHQALKILLKEFDFAMILMDVKMPGLNGFDTATLICEREKLRHIPIIFITANNYGDENIFKGYQAGGIDYIFKPINPEVLRAKVAVFIDLYRKNAQLLEHDQKLSLTNKNLESEINDLKTNEEKSKLLNNRLQKEILNLEAIIASSKLQFDQFEFEPSDLTGLFRSVFSDMEDLVKDKTATVSIEPLPTAKVSPVLIRSLFQNLIRNVLVNRKESANLVIKIHSVIGASAKAEHFKNGNHADYSHIVVEDNGDPLHLNGEAREMNESLAFCNKIMRKHNGFISSKSNMNEGSTVTISFPLIR